MSKDFLNFMIEGIKMDMRRVRSFLVELQELLQKYPDIKFVAEDYCGVDVGVLYEYPHNGKMNIYSLSIAKGVKNSKTSKTDGVDVLEFSDLDREIRSLDVLLGR